MSYKKMKSVLISIRPKWCELIASGKKTVEVRKTAPKLGSPFKVYIYCTNNGGTLHSAYDGLYYHLSNVGKDDVSCVNGKVIGEFVCDSLIWVLSHSSIFAGHPLFYSQAINDACLTHDEVEKYSGGKDVYGWHITDLVIYDKPRELGEFNTFCKSYYEGDKCDDCKYFINGRGYEYDESDCGCNGLKPLERPPQSWCYVD